MQVVPFGTLSTIHHKLIFHTPGPTVSKLETCQKLTKAKNNIGLLAIESVRRILRYILITYMEHFLRHHTHTWL